MTRDATSGESGFGSCTIEMNYCTRQVAQAPAARSECPHKGRGYTVAAETGRAAAGS